MTSTVVNLRTIRKQRARKEDARKADENAARHGRPKSRRLLEEARTEKATRDHEAHRREPPEE